MTEKDLYRINKYIAEAGVCSRRRADEMVSNGRVTLNGETVKEPGVKIDPAKDEVCLDGKKLNLCRRFVYVMLNKPVGCVTTAFDQFGRKTVMDFIRGIGVRVFPVGRLDYNTSGLLLLTNDGDFTNKITHPKHKIEKTYIVTLNSPPKEDDLEKLRRGVIITGGNSKTAFKTAAAKVKMLSSEEKYSVLEITICEGRNRQIRKMCEALNLSVISLHRTKIGALALNGLKSGAYRYLTETDIRKLTQPIGGSPEA